MTIKQQGGIFGRNPTFNDVEVDGTLDANKASGVFNSLTASGPQPLTINTTQNNQIKLQVSGANTGQYLSTATYPHWFTDAAGTGDLLKINTSGNLIVNSGSGIDFSATAGTGTSELFDDYEEGTWTPTVQGAGTAGTYTLSGTTAKYTKVGNQVTVWGQFGFSAASGGTNYTVIGGLPFTYAAGAGVFGAVRTDSFNFTTANPASLVVSATTGASGTTLGILELRDNAGPIDAPISGVSTSTLIGFTVTYSV